MLYVNGAIPKIYHGKKLTFKNTQMKNGHNYKNSRATC